MKTLRLFLLLLLLVPAAFGAQIKISELPLSVSPTDQTYLEIADMLATPKSAKYLLTNLTTRAEFLNATNFFTLTATNIYVTNLFANITYTSNLFVTNIFATNIFATNIFVDNTVTTNLYVSNIFATNIFNNITHVSNLFTTNIFATNIFTTNLFATNIYTSNFFATNIFVTNIYTTNMFISTNITIDQHITLKGGSTIFFTNNTYVTTNTFLFVNSTGGVTGVVLHGTNGVKVTNGTNFTANLAAGANVTLTTNSGVITIASAGSGLGTPGTVISGNTPSSLNDNIFIPDDLTGTNGVWATFATLLTSLPGYTGGGTNYLGDDGEFHPHIFDYVYAGTLIVESNTLALLSVGATNYFDMNHATQTNNVTANLAFSYVTNGVGGYGGTIERKFLNISGSDRTVTWPTIASGVNGWRTNPASALPPAFTNGTWTTVLLEVLGPTDTLARQTNVHVVGVRYN